MNFDVFMELSFSRPADHKWKIPAQNGPICGSQDRPILRYSKPQSEPNVLTTAADGVADREGRPAVDSDVCEPCDIGGHIRRVYVGLKLVRNKLDRSGPLQARLVGTNP